jgi:pantothenate kinase type III
MQGMITIDFGNTHPHAGIFQKTLQQWQLLKTVPWHQLQDELQALHMSPHNTSLVLCEVKAREQELQPLLEQGYLLTRLKDYWRGQRFAGMPVHYAHTLGEDRLIAAYYCYKQGQLPTLIIDAGTMLTMDLVTSAGFVGGYIIPGRQAYLNSYQAGEQLKEVKIELQLSPGLPLNTAAAMGNSYLAFAALAKELIKTHRIQKLVITGGDASLWERAFQHQEGLVVEVNRDLLHSALHYWMTTQIEPV